MYRVRLCLPKSEGQISYNKAMPILPDVEKRIRREIRDMARDPLITFSQLAKKLEKTFNHGFSRRYAKLADKVARQSIIEADRTEIEQRMNVTREKFRIAPSAFIYWTPEDDPGERRPWTSEVIEAAAKDLAMLELALMNVEIANGFCKQPVEEVRYEPLPDEVRAVVIAAWRFVVESRD
jgi:hypothetical protein